ncbi:hypothetical protein QMK17_25385 [Rhodococcus sp. G-MC3]|nr:hypothetical protein [Rhodococcus sp. G-MC3]MDJ0396636.1 hypothetical protein [Rhodococcus sp. G-MC3]
MGKGISGDRARGLAVDTEAPGRIGDRTQAGNEFAVEFGVEFGGQSAGGA